MDPGFRRGDDQGVCGFCQGGGPGVSVIPAERRASKPESMFFPLGIHVFSP